MTDTLFNIEPTTPKWQELADLHGIECYYQESGHMLVWRYRARTGRDETGGRNNSYPSFETLWVADGFDMTRSNFKYWAMCPC
jgi:hypothetical protein